MRKKEKYYNGGIYHLFNKSIANYGIFKDPDNAEKFIKLLSYYNDSLVSKSYSHFIREKGEYFAENLLIPKPTAYVKYISYCIMPDHYHLLLKILQKEFISKYMSDLENSFTKSFNIKFNRKGPLWQSNYKVVRIKNNDQLLHVSRYININPTTSFLVDKPEDWIYSSYRSLTKNKIYLGKYLREISISDPVSYKKFCENNIDYQRKLKLIKKLTLE